jgi:hypothetical protein
MDDPASELDEFESDIEEDELIKEKKFAEVFLVNWSLVEISVDDCVSYLFGYHSSEDEAEILNEVSLVRKLAYLRKRKMITHKEFKMFDDLRVRRNEVVHRGGVFLERFDRELAEDSRKAARVAVLAANRILNQNPELASRIEQLFDTGL